MKLSILIPTIPGREDKLNELFTAIEGQIGDADVEVLCFKDNKKRSIGYKRDALKNIARGEYIAFVDDDDFVSGDYVSEILEAITHKPDVITFKQKCFISGDPVIVTFGLGSENEVMKFNEDMQYIPISRAPFPCCAYKRTLVKDISYPDVGYGEDWHWSAQANDRCKTSYHISKVLHYYTYDENVSEAPTQTNEIWKNPNE